MSKRWPWLLAGGLLVAGAALVYRGRKRGSFLFVTDTHGSAQANRRLADALRQEKDYCFIAHGGDLADNPGLWRPWWDTIFHDIGRWEPVSGNHDLDGADQAAAFRRRFPQTLPRVVSCGDMDLFLLPWQRGHYDWLGRAVAASTARRKILVRHLPVWPVRGEATDAGRFGEDLLGQFDLILTGHNHVFQDSSRRIGSKTVRQIIEVSGPKHYACPPTAQGCVAGRSGYLRVTSTSRGLQVTRQEV